MSITDGVQLTTLENGLTVLTKEIHTAPVVTVWIWYKVGSRNEREGITGCSHWVEHMLFKGGERFKKGDIFTRIARLGGYNNGFTSQNFTVYFETLPAEAADLGLDIEADRMAHALFDPAETESERTVIISEREGAENSPEYLLWEEMDSAAFRVHPYRWPVVGHKCDLEQMTREELYEYYRTYYGPNNAILAVIGDFSTPEMLQKVKSYFGAIPAAASPPRVRAVEPPQQGERRVRLRRPGAAAYLQVGFHVPAAGHADLFPLIMLDAILSGAKPIAFHSGAWMGRSSRLQRALVDGNLASSVGSQVALSPDPSLFIFSATARAGVETQRVEDALLAELDKIAAKPPSAQEMEKTLRQTRAQLAYGADGVTGQAYALGYFACVSSVEYLSSFVENLSKVKAEEVSRVAAEYLKADNRTLGWFLPTEESSGAAAPAPTHAFAVSPLAFHHPPSSLSFPHASPSSPFMGEDKGGGDSPHPALPYKGGGNGGPTVAVERFPLSCGGVLLVCPNPNTPTAAIRATLTTGGIRETDEKNGLAHLAGHLVMRGTARHTYQEIADEVESLGASLSFGASFDAAHAEAKCMSEDVGRLLNYIAECWREPVFPAEEVEKVRSETLTALREQKDDTRDMAENTLRRLLYPAGHPYGRNSLGEEEIAAALTREEILAFHRTHFHPQGMILVVAGDVQPKAVLEAAEKALAGWDAGEVSAPVVPPMERARQVRRKVLPMMHKSQADIALGFPALTRQDPDYQAADLACLIVGRLGLMGRLGKSVRDKQGLAYYAFSRLAAWKYGGHWLVQAGVNPKNVDRALESIWQEMKLLAAEPVSEEELADAKSNQVGALALRLETNDGLAAMVYEMEYHNLGLDYPARFPEIIRSLTREQLVQAAARCLAPETAVEVIAGPYQ